jgi:hypothetical protein
VEVNTSASSGENPNQKLEQDFELSEQKIQIQEPSKPALEKEEEKVEIDEHDITCPICFGIMGLPI